MSPRHLRIVASLALGSTALMTACERTQGALRSRDESSTARNEIPPPPGGPNCSCADPARSSGDRCTPAQLDAGCTTFYTPGGPLPPPDVALA